MANRIDVMQRLAESLVEGTERRVISEKNRLEQAGFDSLGRLSDISAMSADVAQMRADTDAAVAAMEQARVEQSVVDTADRAEAEGIRLEQAAFDSRGRLSDISAMSADVAQMRADTDAAVAELTAISAQSADILRAALRTASEIRSGRNASVVTQESKVEYFEPVVDVVVEPEPVVDVVVEPEPVVKTTAARTTAAKPAEKKPVAKKPAAKTTAAKPVVKATAAKPAVKKPVVKKPAVKKPEPVVQPKPVADADQGRMPNKPEIFAFIADHPDGVTLDEISEHFGVKHKDSRRTLKEMYESEHNVTLDNQTGRYFAV